MSDKKLSEESLKKYIAALKSQLSFYRDRCLEFQQREWREQELIEEMKESLERHKQEKVELLEQIDLLKSFINDVSAIKDGRRNKEIEEVEKTRAQVEETLVKETVFEQENHHRNRNRAGNDSWFMRVLQEQNAISKRHHPHK
ncbi:hypothetical protein ACFOU2_13345 [Bacillus songklensis]|uniref:Flagellar FliJ protein n=1 Tax=Bacillus songklensis TaxID=1069116 RepID=A0ABV8B3J7_9BACI